MNFGEQANQYWIKLTKKISQELELNQWKSTDQIIDYNTVSLSHHEQVCLMRLRFKRYFSHHGAT